MKISMISTVKNEEKNIKRFIDSIINQTKKPDEFIITDSSEDKTYDILKKYSKKYKWIKAYHYKNANISEGRNIAIKKAKNEIIVVTDAGCLVDKNWVKEITKPFPEFDFVAGNYNFIAKNDFEYFQGKSIVHKVDRPSRISSRSVAFKKSFWKKVNGYPEDTYTGEDTKLNIRLLEAGAKLSFAKKAIVMWEMRPTWKKLAKQFYLYGKGDKTTRNILKMKRNILYLAVFWLLILTGLVFAFINLWISLIILCLFLGFFLLEGVSLWKKSKKIKGLFYGFALSAIKRINYVLGATFG